MTLSIDTRLLNSSFVLLDVDRTFKNDCQELLKHLYCKCILSGFQVVYIGHIITNGYSRSRLSSLFP